MPAPFVISRLDSGGESGPEVLRDFLEKMVEASATRGELIVGEAEPGRYLLVSPPLDAATMKGQIDAGVALVIDRLAQRWPDPHVTDFGLKEMYAKAKQPWLAERGFEELVKDGKLGVVTIFCHEWVYDVCARVARDQGLDVRTNFGEYLKTGRVAVAAMNAFAIDVFTNLREMAADFYPVDHLVAKVLVLGAVGGDTTLAAHIVGIACRRCGAFIPPKGTACPSCGAPAK